MVMAERQRGPTAPAIFMRDHAAPTCRMVSSHSGTATEVPIPPYLESTYWWAYVRPRAVRLFERSWLINLILWGNYRRLRDVALAMLRNPLPGHTLQLACVYGDLTCRLSQRVAASAGKLDVVDVLKVQLQNLHTKLPADAPVRYLQMNTTALALPDAHYDNVLMFFLLHEQPAAVRHATLQEALRVVKPGGQIVIIDFSQPYWWNPLRYFWLPVLGLLEPFAPALWQKPSLTELIPTIPAWTMQECHRLFGGLYQALCLQKTLPDTPA